LMYSAAAGYYSLLRIESVPAPEEEKKKKKKKKGMEHCSYKVVQKPDPSLQ